MQGQNKLISINNARPVQYDYFQIYKNHFIGTTGQHQDYFDFIAMVEKGDVIHLYDRSDYYNPHGIEAWEVIEKALAFYGGDLNSSEAFYIGNILKYVLRYPYKGQKESDLEKAITYLGRL